MERLQKNTVLAFSASDLEMWNVSDCLLKDDAEFMKLLLVSSPTPFPSTMCLPKQPKSMASYCCKSQISHVFYISSPFANHGLSR